MDMKYKMMPLFEEETALLSEKLEAYLEETVPSPPGTPAREEITLCIRDEDGNTVAGCILEICQWGRAVLGKLWAQEEYRGQGLGSMLLGEAERVVREKGCHLLCLATNDFMFRTRNGKNEARTFYEKHGFRVFTVIKDFPRGHESWSLMKRLDAGLPDYTPAHNSAAGKYAVAVGTAEDAKIIGRGLYQFSCENVPDECDETIIAKKLVDENGKLIAGISGMAGGWRACNIDVLWVEEAYRRQGLGSFLLREVEEEAKKYGTYIMLSEAGDWNEGFFRKNGYTIRGTLANYPQGHKCYELEKRF